MTQQRCGTCYFYRFDPVEDPRRGTCRFEPPRLVHVPAMSGTVSLEAAVPTVAEDFWCGKHRNASEPTLGTHGHGG